jgi:hypothetical protein
MVNPTPADAAPPSSIRGTSGATGADGDHPGDLMRQVAHRFIVRGFAVRYPEREFDRRLVLTDPAGLPSVATVGDSGHVLWECKPPVPGDADPKKLADLVTSLLTGRTGNFRYRGDGYRRGGLTLKGIVGRELAARGLTVALDIYSDTDWYEVNAAIAVTNSGRQQDATAWVHDTGCITWERDYWPEAATITWEPDFSWEITDPAKIADRIVNTITTATGNGSPHPSRA